MPDNTLLVTATYPPSPTASIIPGTPVVIPTPTEIPARSPARITSQNAHLLDQVNRLEFDPWHQILGLAWSADGSLLAVAAGDELHLYRRADFKEIDVLQTDQWISSLTFDPKGRFVATSNRGGGFTLWDLANDQPMAELSKEHAHKKAINQIVFSPDGEWLASAGNDGMARIWNIQDGSMINEIIGGAFAIPAIAFTDQGESLAIVNSGVIRIRDVRTSRFVHTLRSNQNIQSIAIHPGFDQLASGNANNSIMIWNIPSESLVTELNSHTGQPGKPSSLIWQIAYSPDGALIASAGGDSTARIWDTKTNLLLATLSGHKQAVTCLSFSPDGTLLATGSIDASLILWSVTPSN